MEIVPENLDGYPTDTPPVSVQYKHRDSNKVPEGMSLYDHEDEDGVTDGECPFIVHGVIGQNLESAKTVDEIKGMALRHFNSNGKALAIDGDPNPQSIYRNLHLYPQMFPWLFPYGMGGIGSTDLSDIAHKWHLLMYHDKRFQMDPCFPFVAFSHEQVKNATTGGYLLADKAKFDDICKWLLSLDPEVLVSLAKQMVSGENVKPQTEMEKLCFQVINDLDQVNSHIKGSTTSKKYMRNEIWSLIAYLGAPTWFITFAPGDNFHPISLYFADTNEIFSPEL